MQSLSTALKLQVQIVDKLSELNATSPRSAVNAREAGFDLEEMNWLNYIAGGLFSKVKKTRDKRYYIVKTAQINY